MKTKKLLYLLLSLLLIASIIPVNASALNKDTAPIGNPVYYIETYEQLVAHALIAQADCRYILNDDIEQEDNSNDLEVVIPTGAVFNLDLNGYNIKRSTQGNDCALFRIRSGGRMTINDTSESQTGGCSFSEGYADYSKAVFYNEGGELEILGGYYEIFSPFEQGDCSIVRTTSGYTNIYDGTFDSSAAWGGDTISVGHYSYLYEVPHVNIFGGEFYGKYSNIDVTPFNNYLSYGCLYPTVYVLGGNFYITKENESSGFCYCNNGWGKVIVAAGTVPYKCLNSRDQRFLDGISKKYITQTIDDYTTGYYEVTAPPMIMSEKIDYYYRLINLCLKADISSYDSSVYELHKEDFDEILSNIDTIMVFETETNPPEFTLENRTANHQYINWYICDESAYNGKETLWTHLGDLQNISQWTYTERPENAASYIIRCVATNSNLSTYEDIIRLNFAPLKKSEIVESVKVTDVKTPVAGEAPDFLLTAEESFYINGVFWKDLTDNISLKETDTFKDGHQYELEVWLRANEFYNFKLDSDDCLDITALINDKEAEVILPGTAISAELKVTYTVSEKTTDSTDPTEQTQTTSTSVSETSSTSTEPTSTTASSPTGTSETDPTETTETTKATDSTPPTETTKTEPTKTTTDTGADKTTNSTSPTTDSSNPVDDKGILGDVNGDGKVNIKDATMIQKAVAKIINLADAEQIRANVNADTKVNIKDATAIQKFVAKIETGFPIGEKIA